MYLPQSREMSSWAEKLPSHQPAHCRGGGLRIGVLSLVTASAIALGAAGHAVANDICDGEKHIACDGEWINDDDFFGEPAISGPWAVLGKRGDNEAATDAGAIYFYRLVSGRWQHLEKIPHPGPLADQWFGQSVAIDGDIAVGSAPGWDFETGRLLVFEYDDGTGEWDLVDQLFVFDGEQGDALGGGFDGLWRNGVAVRRGTIAGGAPMAALPDPGDPGNDLSAAGFVATFRGGQQKLIDSAFFGLPPVQGGYFGGAVALDENRIAIGEPGRDNTGRVYVARFESGQWITEAVLASPDPAAGAIFNFGFALDLEGDTLLVGAPNEGRAHFFEYDDVTETWGYSGVTIEEGPFFSGNFGNSVALSGSLVLIGSSVEEASSVAYLYQRDSQGEWQLAQTFAGAETGCCFGHSLALSSDGAIISDISASIDDGQGGSITNAGTPYFFRNLPSCDQYDPTCGN